MPQTVPPFPRLLFVPRRPAHRPLPWNFRTDASSTGKTGDLLGSSAALLLNALKELSGIDHDVHVLSPESIAPIQTLKTKYLGSKNPRLHTDEVLIALSATAAQSEDAQKALSCLPQLKGCQVHSSVMLSDVDRKMFQRLGCDLTCEPKFQ